VFLIAMDPAAFGDSVEYRRLTSETLAAVRSVPPAPGKDEVLYPGEPEARSRTERGRDGIPIPESIWQQLTEIGTRYNVPMPESA
jgi:LDH2 family malate/lactate/ureidoglycolate dehydrogenase